MLKIGLGNKMSALFILNLRTVRRASADPPRIRLLFWRPNLDSFHGGASRRGRGLSLKPFIIFVPSSLPKFERSHSIPISFYSVTTPTGARLFFNLSFHSLIFSMLTSRRKLLLRSKLRQVNNKPNRAKRGAIQVTNPNVSCMRLDNRLQGALCTRFTRSSTNLSAVFNATGRESVSSQR